MRLDLTPVSGPVQTVLVTAGATTTSTFAFSSPSDFLLSSAALGGTLTIDWVLPTGFQVVRQRNGCVVQSGSSLEQDFDPAVEPLTTTISADFSLPTTLDDGSGPVPVTSVTINVAIEGPGGARMMILHRLDQP